MRFECPNFDLQKYDAGGRFSFVNGQSIRLSFRIEKGAGFHLLKSTLSVDQEVKETDGRYEISATVVEKTQSEGRLMGGRESR